MSKRGNYTVELTDAGRAMAKLERVRAILDSWAWTGGAMSSADACAMYAQLRKEMSVP